jgi:hypothetical protein
VLKCSLAYLLGTMGTLWSPLADSLGRREGKHIVATITVYFHPARTVGSMLEAILISITAVLYSQSLSFLSMGTSVLLDTKAGLVTLSRLCVLVLYIGGGLGFVGWVKQKFNKPLVNVACTLASIAIISSITKEELAYEGDFSTEQNEQSLKMLVLGILITGTVNILVWRSSARTVLRESLTSAVVSLGDKLAMITRGFLNGSEDEVNSPDFASVASQYETASATISTSLRESKFEYYVVGCEQQYFAAKSIVARVEKLSQAVGGLRTACDTQFVLLKETPTTDVDQGIFSPTNPMSPMTRPELNRTVSSFLRTSRDRLAALEVISESSELASTPEPSPEPTWPEPTQSSTTFRMPSEIFEVFIHRLGPSMKSLAYTLSEILRQPPFVPVNGGFEVIVNPNFKNSLSEARSLFDSARASALEELYSSVELERSRSEKIQADIEEVAASCSHFSYSLQSVAEEIDEYLDALEDYKFVVDSKIRSWRWLHFWKYVWKAGKRTDSGLDDPEGRSLISSAVEVRPLRKSAVPRGIPDQMLKKRDNYSWDASPNVRGYTKTVSLVALRFMRFLTRDDSKWTYRVGSPEGHRKLTLCPCSSFWHKGRSRRHHLGRHGLHTCHPPDIQAVEGRVGPPELHDRHCHDCRREQHDVPRPLPRHRRRGGVRHYRLAHQRRRPLRAGLPGVAHEPVQLLPRL